MLTSKPIVDDTQVIYSDCALCVHCCGVNYYVKEGRLVKVEGMAEHPSNLGILCPKGTRLLEWVYSPNRLKYPMKKVDGGWKRVSWDEALDDIAARLSEIRKKFGGRALAIYSGSVGVERVDMAAFGQRFKGVFGSPNFISVESICFRAQIMTKQLTFNRYLSPDADAEKSNCVVIWGHNPTESNILLAKRIDKGLERGMKLIVIDPRRIPLAKKGLYLQIRPGTDVALGLAMLNVIISEDLYDHEFVEKWTFGFEQLREHVKQYPPEKVEEITGVPASDIKHAARIFASSKPACIVQGTCGLDHHASTLQNTRVLCILQAVTGNVEVEGGWITVPNMPISDLRVPVQDIPIGAEEYPLFYKLWKRVTPYGHALDFPRAVLEGKPYPVRALIVCGGNPALSFPDSNKFRETVEHLDLTVVIDPFMTETAEMADYALPASTFLEQTGIGGYPLPQVHGFSYTILRRKIIEPLWESWPDWKFWTELAHRLGHVEEFPWKTEEEILKYLLTPSVITYKQLEDNPKGIYFGTKASGLHNRIGFSTPSGKIEIYSETLKNLGHDPLPTYKEPTESHISTPELAKKYPLTLITGTRISQYIHTQLRDLPEIRQQFPDPVVEIHPSTARKYGIANSDMVAVETKKGSIRLKAKVTEDIAPDVVSVAHGWAQANANILTDINLRSPILGYPQLKSILCQIRKL